MLYIIYTYILRHYLQLYITCIKKPHTHTHSLITFLYLQYIANNTSHYYIMCNIIYDILSNIYNTYIAYLNHIETYAFYIHIFFFLLHAHKVSDTLSLGVCIYKKKIARYIDKNIYSIYNI